MEDDAQTQDTKSDRCGEEKREPGEREVPTRARLGRRRTAAGSEAPPAGGVLAGGGDPYWSAAGEFRFTRAASSGDASKRATAAVELKSAPRKGPFYIPMA